MSLLVAQVSDTHFDHSAQVAERNARVWDYLERLPFDLDLILLTGDVTDHGLSNEYREAAARISSRHPVLAIPGNHDRRADFTAGLHGAAAPEVEGDPLNRSVTMPGGVVIGLDSTIPSDSGTRVDPGRLSEATLNWLDWELANRVPGLPALIALHHPPIDVGHPEMDPIRLQNPDDLASVLANYRDVVGIVCGHTHSATAARFAGIQLIISPAVAWGVALKGESGPMLSSEVPAGFVLHSIDSGGLISQFRYL